jgi:hypothetical protein
MVQIFSVGRAGLVIVCDYISAYCYYLDSQCCVYDVTVFPHVVYSKVIFGVGSWLGVFSVLMDL